MKTQFIAFIFILLVSANNLLYAQKGEERKLSAFSEITLRMSGKVHLKQGNNQVVNVKGDQSTLEKLVTEVKDRKLVIRYKTESAFSSGWKPGPVEIFITIPEIDKLTVLGSGSIIAEDLIASRIIDLTLSGSGDMNLADLKTDKVTILLSGSGNVNLAGKAAAAELKGTLSGSGNIKAKDFNADDVNVKIAGSGNCWITANKNLIARIAGSGSVFYRGNPAIDQSITGSGKVKAE